MKTKLLALVVLLGAHSAFAEDKPEGFLCCNMRTDGAWISDINYVEEGKHVIPLGTPIKATGYGRYRVYVEVEGKKQALGNDYSRDMKLDAFAKRYIVSENPKDKLASFPKPIQTAIANAKVTKGMSREQVLMAVGYPVTSETPDLTGKVWRFWLGSFSEFRVKFNEAGIVTDIQADPDAEDQAVQP
jgi:hypothetical protein